MGIPVLAEIERLITEHGSAAILRERLALAAEQYSALEKKVVELQAENKHLKSENSKLQEQVRQSRCEISTARQLKTATRMAMFVTIAVAPISKEPEAGQTPCLVGSAQSKQSSIASRAERKVHSFKTHGSYGPHPQPGG